MDLASRIILGFEEIQLGKEILSTGCSNLVLLMLSVTFPGLALPPPLPYVRGLFHSYLVK